MQDQDPFHRSDALSRHPEDAVRRAMLETGIWVRLERHFKTLSDEQFLQFLRELTRIVPEAQELVDRFVAGQASCSS